MTWPATPTFGTTNVDAGSDSPASARADIRALMDDVGNMIGGRGAASGVASLDSGSRVPTAQLGSGTASAAKYLRGDSAWSQPAWSELSGTPTTLAGYGITDAVGTARTITAGTGLTGGGDLSANRTLAVSYGTTAGTACQGNDSRLSDARTPAAHVLADTSGLGSGHTSSGLTAGQVLRATGATTAAFQSLVAADIPSLDTSKLTTSTLALARGGTNADLSATGGANQVLKQTSGGGAVTVAALVAGDIPSLDATKVTTGTVATARLGSGSAGAATFLSGDQTYKPVPRLNGYQAFTASGSFMVPSGITAVFADAVGAGGGGGWNIDPLGDGFSGGSGGSGSKARKLLTVSPGDTITVTIGAGGTAGSGGASQDGGNGGNTTVVTGATTVTAGGGVKGLKGAAAYGTPGAGGTASGGDFNIAGVAGRGATSVYGAGLPGPPQLGNFGGGGFGGGTNTDTATVGTAGCVELSW